MASPSISCLPCLLSSSSSPFLQTCALPTTPQAGKASLGVRGCVPAVASELDYGEEASTSSSGRVFQGQTSGARRDLALQRRSLGAISGILAAGQCLGVEKALAILPSTAVAGRIPGLSEPDEDGIRTYRRPPGKSGGHGIGWSELIPYSFRVPSDWEEVPVSIADLGGTEIDLRFSSTKEGNLSVVVAPVLRFSSGLGEDAHIEDIGDPERVIYAFGPELTGQTVEGKVMELAVRAKDGRTYYEYELDPHILVSATAAGNRLYIMTVSASSRQWKKYGKELHDIKSSFYVGY